jgi:hypothetical protein
MDMAREAPKDYYLDRFAIVSRCESGHESRVTLYGVSYGMALAIAKLIDGSHPLYSHSPGGSVLGHCCHTTEKNPQACGTKITTTVERIEVDGKPSQLTKMVDVTTDPFDSVPVKKAGHKESPVPGTVIADKEPVIVKTDCMLKWEGESIPPIPDPSTMTMIPPKPFRHIHDKPEKQA